MGGGGVLTVTVNRWTDGLVTIVGEYASKGNRRVRSPDHSAGGHSALGRQNAQTLEGGVLSGVGVLFAQRFFEWALEHKVRAQQERAHTPAQRASSAPGGLLCGARKRSPEVRTLQMRPRHRQRFRRCRRRQVPRQAYWGALRA